MAHPLTDALPDALRGVRTRHLLSLRLAVRGPLPVIPVPGASRRIGVVTGGEFDGERLAGTVMDGGSDWQTQRADGSVVLDVRLVLKTTDGALLAMTYRGVRHAGADVMTRIDAGEEVDPAQVYFRTAVFFETAAAPYDWLNRVVALGIGHRRADGPLYSVFELL